MNDYSKTIESNLVLKKMYELASLRFGKDRVVITHVVPRVLADGKYAWDLFESQTDAAPVETVVLDVDLSRKMEIDDEVGIDLDRHRRTGTGGTGKTG